METSALNLSSAAAAIENPSWLSSRQHRISGTQICAAKSGRISTLSGSRRRMCRITASSADGTGGEPLDRRQLLLMTSATAAVTAAGAAHSAPVQAPDLKRCTTPIDPGNGAPAVDCCLPVSATITDFKLPAAPSLRLRPAAHLVTADYIAKYKKAYDLLRKLPSSDPRAWAQQANVHCAFCDAAYDEAGTSIEYQVHSSWLFFPWHRWYLYFHERILASLINDPSFTLPFWNWDGDATAAAIPAMYADTSSSLYDANRNPAHRPPKVADLNYNFTESTLSTSAQISANYALMYRQMVTNSKTPSLFFGKAYRQGGAAGPGAGTVENLPHGTVHVWTGNPSNPNDEDMGTLYSAAKDPIFYAHHANVDRMWEVWKSFGGRRKDLTDADYLNATFLFYDETASLVRVRIGDALDTTKLGYKYADVPIPWVSGTSSSSVASAATVAAGPGSSPGAALAKNGEIRRRIKQEITEFKSKLKEYKQRASKKLEKVCSNLVKRPKKVKADDFEEEILVLEGVEIPSEERVKFDVYINLPDSDAQGAGVLGVSEYAGSFFNVPRHGMKRSGEEKRLRKSDFRLGIGGVLKELGIEDDDDFAVTIVQRNETSVPVSIDDVRIEYE